MFNIALYEPEIPPNTGNIIRLAANTGCSLHIIEPMGFEWQDKKLRRAGLDYHEFAAVKRHGNFEIFKENLPKSRIFAFTTKGQLNYDEVSYEPGDIFLFGPETRGLPDSVLNSLPESQVLRIPMLPKSRSLNLSNATAIICFEAWRQLKFEGCI